MSTTCGRCGHENVATAKFCAECGAPLTRNCEKCGSTVAPSAKFCSECGHAVAVPGPAPQVSDRFTAPDSYTPQRIAEKVLLSRSAVEGERKHVTVLFADIKDSMELLAGRDPEDARRLLDEVLDRMMEAVHWFEGTVNQVMGDGIMALFGAPVAHEDHAVRACYAAVRMQEAVTQWAQALRQAEGIQVQIRVGVNSGEVVVRSIGSDLRIDYSAVGQTTHVAARMEQMAEPGTILISPSTLGLAEGYVQVRPRGAAAVTGLREPIDVFEITGTAAVRSRLQARAGRGLTKFVGRHDELAQLAGHLERVRQGQGRVVAVIAEPGLGKSRLYAELLHGPQTNDCMVLETGCLSYRRAAAWLPIIELLRAYFQIEPHEEPRKIESKISGRVFSLGELLVPYIPAFLWLLDVPVDDPAWQRLEPPRRRLRALEGVKHLLLGESRVQPVVLVVEDLHWIDTETQTLLNDLVDSLPTTRVLLLLNYRPEYQHGWASKSVYRQLRLDPLALETAEALLGNLLGHDPDIESLKRRLIEHTDGNPFFLEEAISSLREAKVLVGEPGTYRLTQRPHTITVPATVQAILAERIDRLPEEEKRLLQAMAVVGTHVPFSLLREIAEAGDEQLRHWLGHLQTGEFLYESRLVPDLEYSFRHAVIHDVAYGSLVQDRRRALHARIVDVIERVHADRLAEHSERLGHHAFRGERWSDAVTYLRQAGLTAAGRSAPQEAVVCLEQALAALSRLPTSRATQERAVDLRFELQSALAPLGDLDHMVGNLRQAEALATSLEDQHRLGRIAAQMTFCYRWMGELDRGVESGERALAIASALGDVRLEVLTNFRLGQVYLAQGWYRRTIALSKRSLEILAGETGREGFGTPASPAATSRFMLGLGLMALGEASEAIAALEDAVRVAEAIGHEYSRAFAYYGLGLVLTIRGHFPQAIDWLERSLVLFRQENVGYMIALVGNYLGWAYAISGRRAEGRALLDEAEARLVAMRFAVTVAGSTLHRGDAALLEGRFEEAFDCARRALEAAGAREQRPAQMDALRLLGDIHSAGTPTDAASAESSYRRALAIAGDLGARPLEARCHLGLGRLYRRTGQRQQAREHLTMATTMCREMDLRFWLEKVEAEVKELGDFSPRSH